jgi:hypothetical protein
MVEVQIRETRETMRFVPDENSSNDARTMKPTNNAKCPKWDTNYFRSYCDIAVHHLPRHVYAHYAEASEV